MNTFNKKSLYVALASLGTLGVTGAAQAVNVNPDGLGQALIYPYYTTQSLSGGNAYNSLLSVVNSTSSAKVVKVRFLEGKASKEVLDFNLWLSAFDVWTTAVIPSGTGAGIFTTDASCTTPKVSSSATAPTNFVNFAYAGDPLPQTLDRTKEGYVEIIEMGNLTGGTVASVTHVAGVPPCTSLPSGATAPTDLVVGTGGLFGGMTLINVGAGTDYAFGATALASFTATTLWAAAGSIQPDLSQVNPKTSVVFNNTEVVTTDWSASSNTVDAVSATLMHDNVYNEFVLDAATKSGTDWVVTMPTKHFYYTGLNPGVVTKLFQRNLTSSGACDDVAITQWNREEATVQSQSTFSPPPPTQTDSICWEANVITFNNSGVLGSVNLQNIPTSFANGWARLNFSAAPHSLIGGASTRTNTGTGAQTAQAATTYVGLPIIGFAAQSFTNGAVGTPPVLSNYGGNFDHRYTRVIQ
jgi:hypothetical protein